MRHRESGVGVSLLVGTGDTVAASPALRVSPTNHSSGTRLGDRSGAAQSALHLASNFSSSKRHVTTSPITESTFQRSSPLLTTSVEEGFSLGGNHSTIISSGEYSTMDNKYRTRKRLITRSRLTKTEVHADWNGNNEIWR